jgi:YesN/AraC family two-component response regulator
MVQNVLIVDDHDYFRTVFRKYLEDVKNISIIGEAENGKKAIELVAELKPHLIIMDINMPEMDGISASRILKAQYPETKVILYSMYTSELNFKNLANSANAFVAKDDLFVKLPGILDRLQNTPARQENKN